MIRRATLLVALFCCTLFVVEGLAAKAAHAQFPYGGDLAAWNGWGGYGYGYGWGYLGTRVGYVSQPPYFAVHPPVYYSAQIIRRPYGTSPFAWPATYPPFTYATIESQSTMTADADPAFFINPHVVGNGGGQLPPPKDEQSSVQPRLIVNPYVVQKAVVTR